jgi:hypothetical protein
VLLERLLKIMEQVRIRFGAMQGQIRLARGWVLDIEEILADYPRTAEEEQRPSQQVAAKLEAYLRQLEAQADLPDQVAAWRDHLILILHRLWPGLFPCYDQPLLPRTNNALEVFFGGLKRERRRHTGRKGTQDYLLRYGAYLVFDRDEPEKALLDRFRLVNQTDLRAQRLAMRGRSERRRVMWRFRHRRDAFCADIKRRWDQLATELAP